MDNRLLELVQRCSRRKGIFQCTNFALETKVGSRECRDVSHRPQQFPKTSLPRLKISQKEKPQAAGLHSVCRVVQRELRLLLRAYTRS